MCAQFILSYTIYVSAMTPDICSSLYLVTSFSSLDLYDDLSKLMLFIYFIVFYIFTILEKSELSGKNFKLRYPASRNVHG
jgi:hypothetical protein